jgi:tetratricopeptide (TPR) repeat protein
MFGNVTAYLASPFVLYYLYAGLAPEFRSLGTGLSSRQGLKRRLENATLNPRDADAHYQLGLIYVQRRQYEPAIQRFRQAIAVDPNEADAHYQLGRIAREQGRYADALEHCRAAARIDDKHSSSEVWREIGITNLLAGNCEEARQALEKYLSRRPYDPEGECWYGRTMAKLGRCEEARTAFEQTIEAVRTMPSARKRQVSSWESEARKELKKLPAALAAAAFSK